MRVWALALAVLTTGCAQGVNGGTMSDAGIEDVMDVGIEAAPDLITGASCQPMQPPLICEDFHRYNPFDPYPVSWPLNQYYIECDAGWINWDVCTVWSYDPTYYSTDTWAFCCIPLPTPPTM